MSIWKRIKRAVHEYLDRMAKSNQELFGRNTPDCCKMNHTNTRHPRA